MSFKITTQPIERTFTAAGNETVLDAAIQAHVGLPYGCKAGVCGACKCKVVSGEISYGDQPPTLLTQEEQDAGMILTCKAQAQSDLVLDVDLVVSQDPLPVRKFKAQVQTLERISDDVMRIILSLPQNADFRFYAGQFIEFILPDGSRRSYSMANAPQGEEQKSSLIELHLRLMPGGKFTPYVFNQMQENEAVQLEGPFGTFFLRENSKKPIILLASGTGLAPIKAILEHMQAKKSRRTVTLYWGGNRPKDLYLQDWVQQQTKNMPNLTYIPVISAALPQDNWQGRTGFVHHAVMADFPDLSKHQVYACGSLVMVEAAKRDFVEQCQLKEKEFYADAFTSERDQPSGS